MGAPRAPHRDAVLDAWSSRPVASATAIGASLGLSRKAVYCVVATARVEGHPRAVVRGKGYQPPRGFFAPKIVTSDAFSGLQVAAGCRERPHTASRGNA